MHIKSRLRNENSSVQTRTFNVGLALLVLTEIIGFCKRGRYSDRTWSSMARRAMLTGWNGSAKPGGATHASCCPKSTPLPAPMGACCERGAQHMLSTPRHRVHQHQSRALGNRTCATLCAATGRACPRTSGLGGSGIRQGASRRFQVADLARSEERRRRMAEGCALGGKRRAGGALHVASRGCRCLCLSDLRDGDSALPQRRLRRAMARA